MAHRNLLALALAVSVAGLPACSFLGASDEAEQAALEQYAQRSGQSGLRTERSKGWGDCAVVELSLPSDLEWGVSVMLREQDGGWRIVKTEDDGSVFDTDDMLTRGDCLGIADDPPGKP